eukprot:7677461-Alexandrium_andersonii.AAC.1
MSSDAVALASGRAADSGTGVFDMSTHCAPAPDLPPPGNPPGAGGRSHWRRRHRALMGWSCSWG